MPGRRGRARPQGRRTGRLLLSLTGVGVLAAAWYLQDAAGTALAPEVPGQADDAACAEDVPADGGSPPSGAGGHLAACT